jgi:uncharacterized membrane protein YdjX (TVP38/TMEM64 family)
MPQIQIRSYSDWLRLCFPFFLLLAFSLTWKFLDTSSTDLIANSIKGIPNSPWSTFYVVLIYCSLSLFVFPLSILLYGTILTFGYNPGIAYAFIGTLVAAILNYYLGTWFSQRQFFKFLENRNLSDLKESLRNPSLATVIIIRLIPVAPFTIENYLAGAVGVKLNLYILGTFLGLMPGIFSLAFITSALRSHVNNPLYYIPIYFGLSSILLLWVIIGNKIGKSVSRYRLQKKVGSIIYNRLDQIKGVSLYFKNQPWLASYISQMSQGIEGQNYFVKVGGPDGSDALVLFQRLTVTPRELLGYVKAKGTLGKNIVRKILQFLVQDRSIQILVNGCPNLTGDFRFVSKSDAISETDAIIAALQHLRNVIDFDAVIIKDMLTIPERLPMDFLEFQVDPDMVVKNVWASMTEYVAAMRTKYRQRYQSTIKKSKMILMKKLDQFQIEEHKKEINALFENVVKSDKFSLEQVPEDYFIRLSRMPEFSFYGYFSENRLVGFRSSIDATDKLIAHYVGFESEINSEAKIYQRMLYDYVEEGIVKQLPAIHLGRTALEIKSSIGAESENYFLLFHSDNWFYRTVGNYYVKRLSATIYEARSPFRDESIEIKE